MAAYVDEKEIRKQMMTYLLGLILDVVISRVFIAHILVGWETNLHIAIVLAQLLPDTVLTFWPDHYVKELYEKPGFIWWKLRLYHLVSWHFLKTDFPK